MPSGSGSRGWVMWRILCISSAIDPESGTTGPWGDGKGTIIGVCEDIKKPRSIAVRPRLLSGNYPTGKLIDAAATATELARPMRRFCAPSTFIFLPTLFFLAEGSA
jgi:hypothetical protein